MITTVVFDLDDTLVDYAGANRRAAEHFVAAAGWPNVSPSEWLQEWQRARETQQDRLFDGCTELARLRRERMDAVCSRFNRSVGARELQQLTELYVELQSRELTAFADVPEALTKLASYNCVVATNGSLPVQKQKLKRAGLSPYFSTLVCSSEFGIAKPQAGFFHELLRAIHRQPGECAMVGDSLRNDAIPALAIGMLPFLIDRQNRHRDTDGVKRLQTLLDLRAALSCR